jgi:hypothetical protein
VEPDTYQVTVDDAVTLTAAAAATMTSGGTRHLTIRDGDLRTPRRSSP